MVLTSNNLLASGFPAEGRESDYARSLARERTRGRLEHYRESYEGRHGGILLVIDPETGKPKSKMELPSLPRFDGMAFAGGKVYLACVDGEVLCLN
jgi:hypothetical protein